MLEIIIVVLYKSVNNTILRQLSIFAILEYVYLKVCVESPRFFILFFSQTQMKLIQNLHIVFQYLGICKIFAFTNLIRE